MDYSPLFISLRTTLISTFFTFFLGILAAWFVIRLYPPVKGIVDCLFTMPMILPPTVVGYFLLKLFGINSVLGMAFLQLFQARIVFTWQAAAIAAAVVAFPLMYRTVRGAFEQLDPTLAQSAQTLGLSNAYIFWRIILPNSRYGILAGTVLAFARGLGEFGATMMFAGNLPGKTTTIATAVYSAMAAGNDALANKWVLINLSLSFTAMFLMNFFGSTERGTAPRKTLGRKGKS